MKQLSRTDSLKGKKVIVTAGGTKEKIDEVRFITNHSSGKMGAALAEELYIRGADVLLIRAKDAVKPRYLIREEMFETSAELQELIHHYIKDYDTIFHAAAVSDFKVAAPHKGKISSSETFSLNMEPQAKIINHIKAWNPNIKLIAFKATAGQSEKEIVKTAEQKLKETNADAIIANDSSAQGNDTNEVMIVLPNGNITKLDRAPKNKIAESIIEYCIFI
jgi:phosphopantothenoylcysteine decarboxylase/phosphopantothenate--cysteine ligase